MVRATDPGTASSVEIHRRAIVVDGRERSWLESRPADVAPGAPLILVFHGSGQTGHIIRAFTGHGFDALAEREGAIVAYPDGLRRKWNDGRVSPAFRAAASDVDVVFTDQLVGHYVRSGAVDPARVYAVGYSSGGYFVFRLIHERSAMLAGAATISANQALPQTYGAGDSGGEVPVVLIHGNQDPVVPYRGQHGRLNALRPAGGSLSHRETAQYLATRNGITSEYSEIEIPDAADKGTSVIQRDFREPGRAPVRSLTIVGGGHTVPNLIYTAPRIVGRTNSRLDTATAVWDFFQAR